MASDSIGEAAREEIKKLVDELHVEIEVLKNQRQECENELRTLDEKIAAKEDRHHQLKRLLQRHA